MKKFKSLRVLLASVLLATILIPTDMVAAKGPKVPYTQKGVTAELNQTAVNLVSIEDIEKSLEGKEKVTVSFDIDDTLLFSSQYFQYGKTYITPGSFEFLKKQSFWDFVAERGDEDSIPKQSAIDLIQMHQKRGDKVVFITGRTRGSMYKEGEIDKTAKALAKVLNLKEPIAINYTADTPIEPYKYDKTYYIKKNDVQIHYGDSNDDILAAMEAGARPIRVFRAPNSTNRPIPEAGGYGEEVLINSAF